MPVCTRVKKTYASLKGSQATLRIYSAQTRNDEVQAIFDEAINITEQVSKDLEKRIQMLEFKEPQYKGI